MARLHADDVTPPVGITGALLAIGLAWGAASARASDLAPLRVEGRTLCHHGDGVRPVVLRGANLGALFVYEPWMSPMATADSASDQWHLEHVLRQRFGDAEALRLLDVWQTHWFGLGDASRLAARGMNCVRIPIWYGQFEDDDGNPRDGFPRLDTVIETAARHGLYSIIDLHGAFGGQSGPDNHTAARREAKPAFWGGAEQPMHIGRAARLWERLARHYADTPAVAGYDLLNEPLGAPSRAILLATYDRLYRAIRAVDRERIIFIEACWSGHDTDPGGRSRHIHWELDVLEDPAKMGWKNVVYSLHQYGQGVTSIDDRLADIDRHAGWSVPIHIGEFNTYGDTPAFIHAVAEFDRRGIHWNMWNFKAVRETPPAGSEVNTDSWGLFNLEPRSPLWNERADLKADPSDTIRRKWGRFTADAFASNPELELVFPTAAP